MQNYQYPNQPQYNQVQNPIINQGPPVMPPNYYPPQNYNTMPVMPGSGVPLLVNQNPNANLSLRAVECFDDLNGSSEAIVTKYFEGLLFPDTKYDVSIKYRDGGIDRKIFIGKKGSGSVLDKNAFKILVKYIPRDCNVSDVLKDKKFDIRFFDVTTVSQLVKGCSKPQVQVLNVENNTIFGTIKQPSICCCSDPDFQINNQNYIKYRVVTNGCQCGYCCCDGCCCLYPTIDYSILDSNHTHILGNIIKSDFSDSDKEMLNYRIIFPNDATPEDKILIIATSMTIDNFIYRSIGKRKKDN